VLILRICALPIILILLICSVLTASAVSDHKALVICSISDDKIVDAAKPKSREVVKFFDICDQHMSRFYTALTSSNWNHVLQDDYG
jgi:hypothetical protein